MALPGDSVNGGNVFYLSGTFSGSDTITGYFKFTNSFASDSVTMTLVKQ